MNKIKIAVVDDHQMFLDGIASILSLEENFEISIKENSAINALLKIKKSTPDIVITDISMPEMNGLEFIKVLKTNYPEMKILVLSMFQNLNSFKDIDGFLLKETNIETLVNAIKEIVLNNNKYFIGIENNIDTLEFKKTILSSREKEIIQLIAKEFTTEEIAKKLIISKHTIEAHRKNIFLKLNVKNIAGLINMAIRIGVINQ